MLIEMVIFATIAGSAPTANRTWIKDPFVLGTPVLNKPVVVREKYTSTLSLQGIWKSGDAFKAMISNQIVTKGSQIDGAIVKDVQSNKVILLYAASNREVVLRLGKSDE